MALARGTRRSGVCAKPERDASPRERDSVQSLLGGELAAAPSSDPVTDRLDGSSEIDLARKRPMLPDVRRIAPSEAEYRQRERRAEPGSPASRKNPETDDGAPLYLGAGPRGALWAHRD